MKSRILVRNIVSKIRDKQKDKNSLELELDEEM